MKRFKQAMKYGSPAALLALASANSHAALDAAITSAIDATKTDILALLAALTVAGAAIWVGRVIYRYFTVK